MLDWFESRLAKRIDQVRFWMIVRAHPQVRRLDDPKDREWALWYATSESTLWARLGQIALMLVVGPSALIIFVLMGLDFLRFRVGSAWPLVLLGVWLVGAAATAAAVESRRGREAGRRCFLAMRVFGYDVCASCGYDMSGHIDDGTSCRTCPECGRRVPPNEGGPHRRSSQAVNRADLP